MHNCINGIECLRIAGSCWRRRVCDEPICPPLGGGIFLLYLLLPVPVLLAPLFQCPHLYWQAHRRPLFLFRPEMLTRTSAPSSQRAAGPCTVRVRDIDDGPLKPAFVLFWSYCQRATAIPERCLPGGGDIVPGRHSRAGKRGEATVEERGRERGGGHHRCAALVRTLPIGRWQKGVSCRSN